MSRPTRLVLVRHTETAVEADGRCYGRTDIELSNDGMSHAHRIAEVLQAAPVAATYASPLRRSRQLAELIARTHDHGVRIDPRLQEIDFGDFEGRRYSDIEREAPAAYATWMAVPTSLRFPNGEDFADLRNRVSECATQIVDRHEGETVVIVSHAGAIRALLVHVLSMPDASAFRLAQRYGSINVIEFGDGWPILRVMNAVVGPGIERATARAIIGVDEWGQR
ncbi:MAG: alpha-ribazole phosphatase [Acidobacteria bacterium]|nr:alpha-ribazole phosphatase [Acidobacteriota bacterium]